MDKKLFEEEQLTKNIPKKVMEIINAMDSEKTHRICECIFNSCDLSNFVSSISLPQFEEIEKKSALVEEARIKLKSLAKKKPK